MHLKTQPHLTTLLKDHKRVDFKKEKHVNKPNSYHRYSTNP